MFRDLNHVVPLPGVSAASYVVLANGSGAVHSQSNILVRDYAPCFTLYQTLKASNSTAIIGYKNHVATKVSESGLQTSEIY